jgi:hypothetical protein
MAEEQGLELQRKGSFVEGLAEKMGIAARAIDFREGEKIDEGALKNLVRAAVDLNKSKSRR